MDDNITNFTFNCLAKDNLSSDSITDPEHWMIVPDLQVAAAVLAVFYIIFFLIAFCWNLFIVVNYLVKYKLLKEPGNIFLFNYALADLLVAVTVMMFSFVAQAAQEFVFGYTDTVRCGVCDFAGFCTVFFLFVSFHVLAALSIDRFILLSFPLRYKQLMTPWRALVIVVIIWIICFIIAILPFIGFGQHEFNYRFGGCLPRFTGKNLASGLNNFYYILFGALESLIPVMILTITNVFTYRLVSRFLKKKLKRRKAIGYEETTPNKEEDRKYKQQQTQLVKVFGALFITNLIAWTPMLAVVLSIAVGLNTASQVPDGFYIFLWVCFLTMPAVHPIIESFFVKGLRNEIKHAHRAVCRAGRAIWRAVTRDTREAETDTEPPSTLSPNEKDKKKEQDPITEEVDVDELLSSSLSPPECMRNETGKVGRGVLFTEQTNILTRIRVNPTQPSTDSSALLGEVRCVVEDDSISDTLHHKVMIQRHCLDFNGHVPVTTTGKNIQEDCEA